MTGKSSYYDGATDDDIQFNPRASGKLEISSYEVGLGYYMPLSPVLDFAASASYVNSELELFGLSEHGDGYSIDAGLRFMATGKLELNAFADYTDAEGDGETGYRSAAYKAALCKRLLHSCGSRWHPCRRSLIHRTCTSNPRRVVVNSRTASLKLV